VSKQAQETLISLTKDEIWDQARAKNLVRTYKELTFNLQGLPDEIKLLRVKERLQKEIASFRERIAESNGNSFMERLKHYSDSSNDLEAVHKRMLDVISVAVWQNVKKSTEEHYNLLQELLANITLLEQRGSKAADILDHVRQFLVQSEHRNFSESA
jgi:negative regulator of replication initiation